MSIAVLISTYGSDEWRQLAMERAYPSAEHEQPDEIIVHHDPTGTISQVRNAASTQSSAEWLCFLDADDQLAPGYIFAMRRMTRLPGNERRLFTPQVQKIQHGRAQRPRFFPQQPLERANWLVIGTLIHRSLFREIGGFHEWPHGLEDWHLWTRCHKAGARVTKVPRAVYIAHWNDDSKHHVLMRNRNQHLRYYEQARRSVWGDTPPEPVPARSRRRR